jgi:hypothetical protein
MGYRDDKSTEELHFLGNLLVAESLDRTKQLDAKATALTGYCGVILALLVSGFAQKIGTMSGLQQGAVTLAGLSVIIASAMALAVLWVKDFEWFSDLDWFEPTLLEKPETLRRFHVLVMHRLKHQHEQVNADKAALMTKAYSMVVFCGVLLVTALIVAL